jgi:predicted SAM-dependent methyltransferase
MKWESLKKLNLGSGKDKREGYLNLDYSKETNPDIVWNLEKLPLPFEKNTFEEIIANHILEHLHEPLGVMRDLHRICKDGAIIKIRVPYFSHESAYSNITHYHQFTWTSFDLFDESHPEHWQGFEKFKILKKQLRWRKQLAFFNFFNLFPRVYQELFCWIFPAKELYVELKVIK